MDQGIIRQRLAVELQKQIDLVIKGEAKPFKWGIRDCALWAADVHVRAGLPDPMKPWRGKYRSMLGAYKIIAGRGGMEESMKMLAAKMKWKEVAPEQAETGDLGLVKRAIALRKKLGPHGPEMVGLAEVTFCVIRGPQGDWHGPIDNGFSCFPDRDVLSAFDVLSR